MPFDFDEKGPNNIVNIKVLGVGGGGNNAVNRMIKENAKGVEFIVVNTDKQVLGRSVADNRISIGEKLTGGRGAGSDPNVGEKAAGESIEEIQNSLKGADMVFLTAGMGGGTGTGAIPVIAKAAKEMGILTVGVVTKPFEFEGKTRMAVADEGILKLREAVDSLLVIPNERLKQVSQNRITLANAFKEADDVLSRGVQSISELITREGYINLDFADVKKIMQDAGYAHMGVGSATGKDKAEEAAKMAISSPLLESSVKGAKGILVNITASPDIGLDEVTAASNMIASEVDPDANIIWGVGFDESFEDQMNITVIATRFEEKKVVDNDDDDDVFGEKSESTDTDTDDLMSMINNKK